MRLFRSDPPGTVTEPVPTLLRALERGDLRAASDALAARAGTDPVPPPHALWRLGRGLLQVGEARRAVAALELLVDAFPGHGDRPAAQRDLVRALLRTGRRKRARDLLRALEA